MKRLPLILLCWLALVAFTQYKQIRDTKSVLSLKSLPVKQVEIKSKPVKIKMMEPEDQILEIQRRKTLIERETPIVRESLDDEAVEIAEQKILDDENVIDIEDYFDKDDMARGGIVSIR